MDQELREINHSIINPEISELTINQISPSMKMVARTRAHYLKAFLIFQNFQKTTSPLPGK